MAKFNAEDYINELLSQSNYLPVDTTIDDRCIPEAKNCIEFFHNEKFIGNMVPTGLFPKQAEVFIKLFAEFCPYCTDMEYWMGKSENGTSENIKVNESFDEMFKKVQLLEYGICPHCGARKSDLYKQGTLDPHTELTSLMGQRAGKSASTSMGLSYDIHKFLKVPNLQKTYDLLPGSPFTIPLVGMSFDKAKQLLYNALYEYLTKGNWFKKYHEFINEQQSALGIKEDLCTVKDTFARYRHKNILIAPLGPDKRKLRGNTSICAACLTGDTLINTNKGLLYLNELKDYNLEDLQIHSDSKLCHIKNMAYTGEKECLKIILENGQSIKASLEHPFVVNNKLIKAKDLTLQDSLVLDFNSPIMNSNKLYLNYIPLQCPNSYAKCLEAIKDKKSFTSKDLKDSWNRPGETKTIYCLTEELQKLGMVKKDKQHTGRGKLINYFKTDLYDHNYLLDKYTSKYERWNLTFPEYMCPELAYILGMFISEGNYYYEEREMCINNTDIVLINKVRDFSKKIFNYDPPVSEFYDKDNDHYTYTLRFSFYNVRHFLRYVGLYIGSYSGIKEIPWSILKADNISQLAFLQGLYDGDGETDLQSNVSYNSTSYKLIQQVQLLLQKFHLGSDFGGQKIPEQIEISTYRHNHKFNNFKSFDTFLSLRTSSQFISTWKNLIGFTNREWLKDKNFRKMNSYKNINSNNYAMKIIAIENIGIQSVYNLTIDSDSHIYAANGILQHNCDEIGWMIAGTSDGIKFDADEIYAALNNSMMTAKEAYLNKLNEGYDNLPAPINFNLSSPSSKKDKICRLYEDSKHDRFMYGIHLSTWEMNPKLPFEGPTMQALKKKNEREFWRDFGAVPPNSSSAFFSSPDLFEDLYQGCNICKIKKVHHFLRDQEFTYGNLIIPKKEFNKPNRLLSMDAGFVNNSFAFTILHMTEKNGVKIPVYDAIVELIPDDQAPLNYSKIYDEIIIPMIEQLNIKLVCTDRWQNLKILSDIENDRSLKCRTKQYSVKYSDFLDFRQAVYDRNIIFPKPEILNSEDIERAGNDSYPYGFEGKPVSHFIFQAITVVDLMGKTVAKGEGLTDDLFRAGVLGYTLIMKDEYAKLFKGGISGSSGSRGIGAIANGGGIAGGSNICAIPTGISGSSSIGAIPGRR